MAHSWGLILFVLTPINQQNIENYNLPRSTNYEVEEMLGSESNSILDFKSIELEINAFPGLRSNILTHLMESPNKECNIPDAVKRINKLYPTRQPFLLRLGIADI